MHWNTCDYKYVFPSALNANNEIKNLFRDLNYL